VPPYLDEEKEAVAEVAAGLAEDGMTIGLGTGTTVGWFLPALARRGLRLRCVASSPATQAAAEALGIRVEPFRGITRLDLAVDGADQVAPDGWLMKGAGGAHTRERIVAASARRFVVIVSSDKPVDALRAPVPLELLAFGLDATLARLGDVRLRNQTSPDGGQLADWHGEIADPARCAAMLSSTPGVVSHGLFEPSLMTDLVVATGTDVEHRRLR
jgi:ribose 5-phosphate isomerase A